MWILQLQEYFHARKHGDLLTILTSKFYRHSIETPSMTDPQLNSAKLGPAVFSETSVKVRRTLDGSTLCLLHDNQYLFCP